MLYRALGRGLKRLSQTPHVGPDDPIPARHIGNLAISECGRAAVARAVAKETAVRPRVGEIVELVAEPDIVRAVE